MIGLEKNEPTCGRPLGMRMSKDGYLIVADAYLGLFKVNVATGKSGRVAAWSALVSDVDKDDIIPSAEVILCLRYLVDSTMDIRSCK